MFGRASLATLLALLVGACGASHSPEPAAYVSRDDDPPSARAGTSRQAQTGVSNVVSLPPDATELRAFVSELFEAFARPRPAELESMLAPSIARLRGGTTLRSALMRQWFERATRMSLPATPRAEAWLDLDALTVSPLPRETARASRLSPTDVLVVVPLLGRGAELFGDAQHDGRIELVVRFEREATLVGLW